MTDLRRRLTSLPEPISVGIIGAGAMGCGLHYQTLVTPGIRCSALADIDLRRPTACAEAAKERYEVVETPEEMALAIEQGLLAVCTDGALIAEAGGVDVLLEASSSIEAAGRFAESALHFGKHLVLMNAEIDLAFGPYLAALADEQGVTYTSCDGDQHGVIKRVWDEVELWGIEPFLAGNIKGFLDREANPTSIIPEADKRNLDYKMATAYTDGTKLSIEMALVANALGLSTDVPGMHGPRAAHVQEALSLFDLEAFKAQGGVVDYILGAEPGGGVFVIGCCDDPFQRRMLKYYKLGPGPNYVFYRPYHICHVEAMRSVAEACLDGVSLLRPEHGFRTNVYAYAKRDLRAGEELDGIGGYACYGQIENVSLHEEDEGLPICLAEPARLVRSIPKGERILLTDVEVARTSDAWRLHDLAVSRGGSTEAPA